MSEKSISFAVKQALSSARETCSLEIGAGVIQSTPRIFQEHFGNNEAVLVADENTYAAAGQAVLDAFLAQQHPVRPPFIFRNSGLYAEFDFVAKLQSSLSVHTAIPVAIGSGTINDLTKLASYLTDRQYLSVATAASMDGYTAFGASITHNGAKRTFQCPAPVAVVADLDVISKAPEPMNSWGYADLIAKVTAGADWILADTLGVEPINPTAWKIVQGRLRQLVADGKGVSERNPETINRIVEGLMLGGFAMQATKSSRPASGAEHQFSHLWDMQRHQHNGSTPSHGFKVGIGTLAVTALYEALLNLPLDQLDIDACCAAWPKKHQLEQQVANSFEEDDLVNVAVREALAKYPDSKQLRRQLTRLRESWRHLSKQLIHQLIPFNTLKQMLQAAGAPTMPEQIGISRTRLRRSFWQAHYIRRRFTVLDLAVRAGVLDKCLNEIFGLQGVWPIEPQNQSQATK